MQFDQYTVTLLMLAPNPPPLDGAALDDLQDEHMAHLADLHEAGHLLAAGPLPGAEGRLFRGTQHLARGHRRGAPSARRASRPGGHRGPVPGGGPPLDGAGRRDPLRPDPLPPLHGRGGRLSGPGGGGVGRYHAAIDRLRSLPWLRIARVLFALYLVGALISVWLPGDWRQADVALYRTDALAFWGHLGHPSLPHEYPLLAIIPFALTLIGPPSVGQDAFALGMAALFVLGFVAIRRWKGASSAWTYAAYTLAAGPATLLFRFDILPALMALGCLWMVERRRFGSAYPLMGLGTLVKLFPLVLLPVTLIAHGRAARGTGTWGTAWRLAGGAALCAVIVAAGFALGHVIDPAHGLGAITYNIGRPVQVESVPATVMWLGSLVGVAARPVYASTSYDLVGGLSGVASAAGYVGLVVGMLWIWWRQLTGRMDTGRAMAGSLLVLLCTDGVLSTQYLLWVAPLVAVVEGYRFRWLAVFLLTALIFPVLYQVAVEYSPVLRYSGWFLAGIAARNVLLVVCTVLFLAGGEGSADAELAPGGAVGDRVRPADRTPSTERTPERTPLPQLHHHGLTDAGGLPDASRSGRREAPSPPESGHPRAGRRLHGRVRRRRAPLRHQQDRPRRLLLALGGDRPARAPPARLHAPGPVRIPTPTDR